MERFPVGFRFHPTDKELVSHYLRNKANLGDDYRSPYVPDCPEFYQFEPWTIWENYGGNSVEDGEPLFFFTKRKKLSPNGSRFDRKVGTGTWSGQYMVKVTDEGKDIGIKRDFRYEGGSLLEQNNAWLMDEYELHKKDITVLCVLRKNPTKPPPKTQGNEIKRKVDEIVDDIEQDLDQRKKLMRDLDQRMKQHRGNLAPVKEETSSCEEPGGSTRRVDHHQASSSWTPSNEVYRPELAPDLAAADDFVFDTRELLASTSDGSNDFLDRFYENNSFDYLASKSNK